MTARSMLRVFPTAGRPSGCGCLSALGRIQAPDGSSGSPIASHPVLMHSETQDILRGWLFGTIFATGSQPPYHSAALDTSGSSKRSVWMSAASAVSCRDVVGDLVLRA